MADKRSFIAAACDKLAGIIADDEASARLTEILGPEKVLVPVPRSSPLSQPDALWVARRICEELVRVGLGKESSVLLERVTAVQKAAFAKSQGKQRPTVDEHIQSLHCVGGFAFAHDITLVDDFVTSGTQFTGAASVLKSVYQNAEIRAFALVRTMSGEEVEKLIVPYRGHVDYSPGSQYSDRV